MKLIFISLALFLSMGTEAKNQPTNPYFQDASFMTPSISPDKKIIAYSYSDQGKTKIATLNRVSNQGLFSMDIGDEFKVGSIRWVNNERFILSLHTRHKWLESMDFKHGMIAINYDGSNQKSISPQYFFKSILPNDENHILVLSREKSDNKFLKKMDINTLKTESYGKKPKKVGKKISTFTDLIINSDDQLTVVFETEVLKSGKTNLFNQYMLVKNPQGEWLTHDFKEAFLYNLGFNIDNSKYYFISNADESSLSTNGLFEYDIKTNQVELIFRDLDYDVTRGVFGANNEVIGVAYRAFMPDYFYLQGEAVQAEIAFHKNLRATYEGQSLFLERYAKDQSTVLTVFSDSQPSKYYEINRANDSVKFLSSQKPEIIPAEMAFVAVHKITARDSLPLHVLTTSAKNQELKKRPMVVFTSDQPFRSNWSWGWHASAQFLANEGYLVLQVNPRGSSGQGEDFINAAKGNAGQNIQNDIIDATHWAIKEGLADPNKICIMGFGFGAYMAIQATIAAPNLFQCAAPMNGMYDLNLNWKKSSTYQHKTMIKDFYFDFMFGEHNHSKFIKSISPAYHVQQTNANLLIIHGKNNRITPIENAYALEKQLKKHNKKFETYYMDQKHWVTDPKINTDLHQRVLTFLNANMDQ